MYPAIWYIYGIVSALLEQAYDRMPGGAPDCQPSSAAPSVGVPNMKIKIVNAQFRRKFFSLLKERWSAGLVDVATTAACKVGAVQEGGGRSGWRDLVTTAGLSSARGTRAHS